METLFVYILTQRNGKARPILFICSGGTRGWLGLATATPEKIRNYFNTLDILKKKLYINIYLFAHQK
jgi:hypothetical protein